MVTLHVGVQLAGTLLSVASWLVRRSLLVQKIRGLRGHWNDISMHRLCIGAEETYLNVLDADLAASSLSFLSFCPGGVLTRLDAPESSF